MATRPYLRTACDYVHFNPIRTHLLAAEDRLLAYPWSSFPLYLSAPEHRPRWLRADRLLGEHGIPQDTPASRQEFERHMERRRLEEVNELALEEFRQGWSIGGEAFRRECLEQMDGKLENHWGHILSFGQMGLDSVILPWFYERMARALRIERPGGRYHVTARGNDRKDIFRDDTDHFHFLELLSQLGERLGVRTTYFQCLT